jgi:serine/threonine protein kinase/TPR repeat protein
MTMVGQYEIKELLGAGGIGQVHAALDTVLQREVALKSLRPEMLSDASFVERFRAEATNLARLNHPNITTLYTLLEDSGNLYLVMECVRGETLEDLLKKRGGRLSVKESLAIVAQVADGLSYAHSMGIVHRDIKPANVMITSAGLAKIMDFGIARKAGSQRLTRDGSIVGTLAYMAPEQLRGKDADGRSDQYSTAIMLYEMISGAVPFEASTDYDLMQLHVNAQPRRLGSRVSGIDSKIDTALTRALAKKPEQRFASMREFSDSLGAAALRTDASKIVHDGTRLIDVPTLEPLLPPSALTSVLDRLTFIPPDMRMFAALGAGGVLLVALAMGVIVMLTPTSAQVQAGRGGSSSSPGGVASAPSRKDGPSSPAYTTASQVPDKSANPTGATPVQGKTVVASNDRNSVPDAVSPPRPPNAGGDSSARAPGVAALTPGDGSKTVGGVTTSPPSATAPHDQGSPAKREITAALSHKDYSRAFEIAEPLARDGDPDAQYALGYILERGLNGTKDEKQAADYYLKAAQKGHLSSAFKLAQMYESGRGVESKSDEQAFFWYRKVAEAGDIDAMYNVAAMYQAGRGTEKSYEHAFDWYLKAAKLGDPQAQNSLGILYHSGMGTSHSESDAVYWFRVAAEAGFAKAQRNLAEMYYSGAGVSQADRREAFGWYKRAAEQNDAGAEFALGRYYEEGISPVDRDYDKAAEWYRKAAEHGSSKAQPAIESLKSRGLIKES